MYVDEEFPGYQRTENRFFTYNLLGCRDDEIQINGIGLKEQMKPCFNKRINGNNDYLILYFYDNVDIYVGDNVFNNVKNKWIILAPGQSHSYGNNKKTWCHSWMHFSGKYVENQFLENKIILNQLLDANISNIFETLLTDLHQEVYFNEYPLMTIIKNHLNNFMLKTSRKISNDICHHTPEEYIHIKQVLDFRYSEKLELNSLAKITGCSIQHFCQKFKSIYNVSPIDYLVNKRISIAKQFLETTNMRINEISYKVGYNDIYYFSRLFKSREGCSPSLYRKRLLN